MSITLGTTCTACQTERKRKGIRYDPRTFEPYCENPYACTPDHPNSPGNIAERGEKHGKDHAVLNMLTYEEASERFAEWLQEKYNPEESERIRRMTTKPVTFRVGSYEVAEFLLHKQADWGMRSVSDVVRFCIEYTQQAMNGEFLPVPVAEYDEDEDEDTNEQEEEEEEEAEAKKQEEWTF